MRIAKSRFTKATFLLICCFSIEGCIDRPTENDSANTSLTTQNGNQINAGNSKEKFPGKVLDRQWIQHGNQFRDSFFGEFQFKFSSQKSKRSQIRKVLDISPPDNRFVEFRNFSILDENPCVVTEITSLQIQDYHRREIFHQGSHQVRSFMNKKENYSLLIDLIQDTRNCPRTTQNETTINFEISP